MKLEKEKELKGKVFNNFTFLKYIRKQGGKFYCMFKCVCGSEVEKRLDRVKSGENKHCGCLKSTKKAEIVKKRVVQDEKNMLINKLYSSYKKSANRRNHYFNITIDYFSELIFKDCFYCEAPPLQKLVGDGKVREYEGILYNGIDRVLNNEGYTEDNTVVCCGYCNRAKGTYSAEAMKEYINRIKRSKN